MSGGSSSEPVIVAAGLGRRFGAKAALASVSLSLRRGAVYGLVGANGAGKTTLIRHLLGLLRAETGSVRVFGLDPVAEPVAVLSRIGYLSEENDLPGWMRVDELLRYTRAFYPAWDDAYAEELRESFALDPAAKIKSLSKGEKARAGLLLALAHRPELLMLDEPSSGLDPIARRDILGAVIRTIAHEGRTVLFSSHLLDEVEAVADHVTLIHHGRIVLSSRGDRVADREGFLVAYPSGARGSGPRIWHVEDDSDLVRDVRFIATLIDTLKAQYDVDSTRIYANGLSNGGGMAFVLSCTLSDRVAAVGMVAAALTLSWHWCRDPRSVPAIWIHGTADPVVPYTGGTSWVAPGHPFPSIPTFVASWSRRNRCGATPVDSVIAAHIVRREYDQCANDATVVLYAVRGGGHNWPGGELLPDAWLGPTSTEVDAASLMWTFFRAHPLPQH